MLVISGLVFRVMLFCIVFIVVLVSKERIIIQKKEVGQGEGIRGVGQLGEKFEVVRIFFWKVLVVLDGVGLFIFQYVQCLFYLDGFRQFYYYFVFVDEIGGFVEQLCIRYGYGVGFFFDQYSVVQFYIVFSYRRDQVFVLDGQERFSFYFVVRIIVLGRLLCFFIQRFYFVGELGERLFFVISLKNLWYINYYIFFFSEKLIIFFRLF